MAEVPTPLTPVRSPVSEAERLRLFESVVVNAHDAVVITEAEPIEAPGPRIVYVNRAFSRLTGYSPEEVMGRSPRILQGPRTSRAALDAIRRALTRWEPVTVELVNYRKDGTEFVVENSIMPVADERGWYTHWVSVQRDITARHRAEAELRESEEFFRKAFEEGPLGMAVLDPDERVILANRRLALLMGRAPEDIQGRRLYDLVHPDDADRDASEALGLLRGTIDSYRVDKRFPRPDGETRWARLTAARVDDAQDGAQHVLAMVEDITDQRRDREALVQAKEAAERAAKVRAAFLATVSHELRTPLHAMLGFGRVLDKGAYGPLTTKQRQYLGHMLEAAEHMGRLVEALLDLRRHEDSPEPMPTTPVSVSECLARARVLAGPLLDERGHTVTEDVSASLPRVMADHDALVQVLVNLLSNAARYTPPGGHVTVRGLHDAARGTVSIAVEDDGIGVAPEDRERVFDYLAQVQSPEAAALRGGQRGTGLGLAIARAMLRRMQGAIDHRPNPVGKGSVFTVTLRAEA
jgi:two-component system sensor histidine kinase/response regulator